MPDMGEFWKENEVSFREPTSARHGGVLERERSKLPRTDQCPTWGSSGKRTKLASENQPVPDMGEFWKENEVSFRDFFVKYYTALKPLYLAGGLSLVW